MGKKKRKSTKKVDWPNILATGLVDFLIGALLILLDKKL